MIYNGPQFLAVTYDPINGCQSPNIFTNQPYRCYGIAWPVITYVVPLSLSVYFNAAAVLSLHRQRRLIGRGSHVGQENSSASLDNVLKRRAAAGLQRATIALSTLFAITSAPLMIVTEIQGITGAIYKLLYMGQYSFIN